MTQATLLRIHPENPQQRMISRVVELLHKGGIIAHPTDTTYALGAHLNNKQGIEQLYRMKRKAINRPLSLLCADLSLISEYAQVDDRAYRIMRRLLPGPYTFILPATKNAPRITQTPRKEVGLRCPADNIIRAIIDELGVPMVSTSCATPDGELLADPQDIMDIFGHQLDIVIDGGYIYPEPSTILDFTSGRPEVVREGKGSADFEF